MTPKKYLQLKILDPKNTTDPPVGLHSESPPPLGNRQTDGRYQNFLKDRYAVDKNKLKRPIIKETSSLLLVLCIAEIINLH